MRRILIVLSLLAGSVFIAAPATADEGTGSPDVSTTKAATTDQAPPVEEPPAEDPPAEDPPAEDPPAEDPPAEDPPKALVAPTGSQSASQRTLVAEVEVVADSTDVKICHRTNSNSNPYVVIPPATAGVANGHDTEHEGPIWNPTLKSQKIEWGDIIEPYTKDGVQYPGQNWGAGEAIYNNGCEIPEPAQPTEVTTEAPVVVAPTCDSDGALILPTTAGVEYTVSPELDGPGTYTVTAAAAATYVLSAQSVTEWTGLNVLAQLSTNDEQCVEHVPDSTNVKICHRTNSNTNPYVVISPATAGVANGHDTQHEGPIWDPTLKALMIEWGDIIEPYTYNEQMYPGQNWEAGEAVYDNDCVFPQTTEVTPEPPTVSPPTCDADGTLNVPSTTGVEYTVSPSFDGPGTYTVTAAALPTYVLSAESVTEWTGLEVLGQLSPNDERCVVPTEVTPEPPTVSPPTCDADGTLNVPSTTGVEYTVSPSFDGPGTYTVTAAALPTYVLSAESVTEWTGLEVLEQLSPNDEQCAQEVTTQAPTVSPPTCDADGTLNVPSTTGVEYTVSPSFDGPGTYTVTAAALPTYILSDDSDTEFSDLKVSGQRSPDDERCAGPTPMMPPPDTNVPVAAITPAPGGGLLPDTGGSSLWLLLMGGLLATAGVLVLNNRGPMAMAGAAKRGRHRR